MREGSPQYGEGGRRQEVGSHVSIALLEGKANDLECKKKGACPVLAEEGNIKMERREEERQLRQTIQNRGYHEKKTRC